MVICLTRALLREHSILLSAYLARPDCARTPSRRVQKWTFQLCQMELEQKAASFGKHDVILFEFVT